VKTIVQQAFQEQFNRPPTIIVRSPGRINLIGEHTDYNHGFVLPAAIDKAIYVGVSASGNDAINLYSIDNQQSFSTTVQERQHSPMLWPDYIIGVADEMKKAGHDIKGFNAVVTGDVPVGAGLSSSAALECAVAFALNELFDLQLDKITMVKLSQKAENNFVGLQCGIMDQFASIMGKKGAVIKLDCDSLEYEYFPLNIEGYKVVLFDSQVKHSLASSEYNTRRKECAAGVAIIQQKYPQVNSLRDATKEMIHELITDELIKKRCLFVVEENGRLLQGCEDLAQGNLTAFGEKMFATHEGLSRQYEVSCRELDFLADLVKDHPAVAGARMMGGGFGGCTINLVKEDAIDTLVPDVEKAYKEKFGIQLKYYIASVENGTAIVP